jgi:4'-phosphopantetheinyl transferase
MSRRVAIFYASFSGRWGEAELNAHLATLPPSLRAPIGRYRRWQDRQLGCLGKLLLRRGLNFYGYPAAALEGLRHTASGRPYLDADIDFNISHSGEFAACAVAAGGRVGIDLEKIVPLALNDLLSCMRRQEQESILSSRNPSATFLDYWVAKESLVKLIGHGIGDGISDILVDKGFGRFHDETIVLKDVPISDGYKSCLATDFEPTEVLLNRCFW